MFQVVVCPIELTGYRKSLSNFSNCPMPVASINFKRVLSISLAFGTIFLGIALCSKKSPKFPLGFFLSLDFIMLII
jgi:hypothetical protein